MLIVLGILVGVVSGFFGVGGGFVLIPLLLTIGFDMKTAIGVSVMQMVFSSIFGSYLNYKKRNLQLNSSILVGLGGGVGALGSGFIVTSLDETTLKLLFVLILVFAILQLLRPIDGKVQKDVHPFWLFSIGGGVGAVAISLGIGGSVLIVPLLVGLLYYPIKKAVSAGLFFVVFSSLFGFISLSYYGQIEYMSGLIVGLASIIGVSIGIWLKDRVNDKQHKRYILLLYCFIFLYMVQELITG